MNNLHQVYVGIGSNIERQKHINNGIKQLRQHFQSLLLSPVYETASVGFEGADFYNLVAGFQTTLSPQEIASILKGIERENGRNHQQAKFSSRTLDIDLLLYDDQILHAQGIAVPRDEILKYAFVLKPLVDIIPHLVHPESGKSLIKHWKEFNQQEQDMHEVEFQIAAP